MREHSHLFVWIYDLRDNQLKVGTLGKVFPIKNHRFYILTLEFSSQIVPIDMDCWFMLHVILNPMVCSVIDSM